MIDLLTFDDLTPMIRDNIITFGLYKAGFDSFTYLAFNTLQDLELLTSDQITNFKNLVKVDNIIYKIKGYGYLFIVEPL
jgi:hypothetical protein